jgi:hypothetical protein
MKKLTYILPLVLTLTACGGGGGGGSGSGSTSTNPGTGTGTGATGTGTTGTGTTGTGTTGAGTGTTGTGTGTTGTGAGTGTTGTGTGTTGTGTGTTGTGTGTTGTGTGTTGTGTGTTGTGTDTSGNGLSLDQYAGTWVGPCLSGGRERTTIARVASDTLTITNVAEYYSNLTCTGAVIGTVSFVDSTTGNPAPLTAKYTDTRTGFVFQSSFTSAQTTTVNNFAVSYPETKTKVEGTAVTEQPGPPVTRCIKFNYKDAKGNPLNDVCRNVQSTVPAASTEYGIFLNGPQLILSQKTPQADTTKSYYQFQNPYTKQ